MFRAPIPQKLYKTLMTIENCSRQRVVCVLIMQLDAVKLLFVVSISTLLPKVVLNFHAAKVCIGKVNSLELIVSSSLNFFFLSSVHSICN